MPGCWTARCVVVFVAIVGLVMPAPCSGANADNGSTTLKDAKLTPAEHARAIREASDQPVARAALEIFDLGDHVDHSVSTGLAFGTDGSLSRTVTVTWHRDGRVYVEITFDQDWHVVSSYPSTFAVSVDGVDEPARRTDPAGFWLLVSSGLVFVALVLRWEHARARAWPLVVLALGAVLSLGVSVPIAHARAANVALLGACTLMVLLVPFASRPRPAAGSSPSLPARIGATIAGMSVAGQTMILVLRPDRAWDVMRASFAGASTLVHGQGIYGAIPGRHADSYGPIAYFAYIPGYLVRRIDRSVLYSNVALEIVAAVLLFVVVRRVASSSTAWWSVAVWTSCPIVVDGVVTGNNDVVVACAMLLLLLVWSSPAWRGVAFGALAMTKFVPILLAPLVVSDPRDSARSRLRVVLVALGFMSVVMAMAIIDAYGARSFWNMIEFQLRWRNEERGFLSLVHASELRIVLLGAAACSGLVGAWLVHRHGNRLVAWSMLLTMSIVIASIANLYMSYVTWLVPLVLVSMSLDASRAGSRDSSLAGAPRR